MLPRKHDCLDRAPGAEPLTMRATRARASRSLLQHYCAASAASAAATIIIVDRYATCGVP